MNFVAGFAMVVAAAFRMVEIDSTADLTAVAVGLAELEVATKSVIAEEQAVEIAAVELVKSAVESKFEIAREAGKV